MNDSPVKAHLGSVVMPLVRLLSRCELSWAHRQEVAHAIAACAQAFAAMQSETRAIAGVLAASQAQLSDTPIADYARRGL
jgi:hypothetical protein